MTQTHIAMRGAREHNLKNISLYIPREKLVVIIGLSGSCIDGYASDYCDIVTANRDSRTKAMKELDRITQNPAMMGAKTCIRGTRVTVGMIVGQIGAGETIESLLEAYPYLEREDIMQALRCAAWLAQEREIVLSDA